MTERSLAERSPFLDDICGETGLLKADSYSILAFELFHSLHLGVSKSWKNCIIQYFSSKDACSNLNEPSGRQKQLSLLMTPLLRASNTVLAQIIERFTLPGFHVGFAKRERTAQLTGLFTGDRLRGLLEAKNYYAMAMVFLLTASFIVKSSGFEERCDLTRVSAQYSRIVNKVLVDKRNELWTDGQLKVLRSEIEDLKRVVERVFGSHCPSGLYVIGPHLLHHLVEDSERFGSPFFTDAGPFEHFNVLVRQFYRTTS